MIREKEQAELVELVERCINLRRWGFRRSYLSTTTIAFPYVIYDSEWCRVKFIHYGGDYPGQWSELLVYFGRLHAANDDSYLIWNEEICWCWHSIEDYALNFLDNFSPQEAVKRKYKSHIVEEFRHSEVGRNINFSPEWIVTKHAVIWEHYGQKLFELFDLRRPDLWGKYKQFITEALVLEDEINKEKNFVPARIKGDTEKDKIC